MLLHELFLKNFRRYEEARFKFHPQFTVLIGENGKGKTTILDALAIMLGSYFIGTSMPVGPRTIKNSDRRLVTYEKGNLIQLEPQVDAYLSVTANVRRDVISWKRYAEDRGGKANEIIIHGMADRKAVSVGFDIDLPLMLYYGSGRLWEIHRDTETEKPGSRLDAYRYCLDPKSDHKAFQKWFKKITFSSLQKKEDIPAENVVKRAVLSCVPGAKDFFFDIDSDMMMIKFDGEIVLFDNLSDGYRNMVAMVADIAHRAARLNPHLGDTTLQKTTGVVLIDEIDLHLHPKWQRRVVRDLQAAFPKMQFIATTHSPFIIQSLDPGEVIDLNQAPITNEINTDGEKYAVPGPQQPYSNRSIEDITEEVMGVEVPQRSYRYSQMYDTAKEYYKLLDEAKRTDNLTELENVKRKLDELSAPFSDNVAYHAFLEMERIAAGLGNSKKGGCE